ncbi:MAG: energy transducer TonB [Thermodesulfovibrionia bacterium]|nr:energy transducer TonB [Thermodesulfovibrionia bacterium]
MMAIFRKRWLAAAVMSLLSNLALFSIVASLTEMKEHRINVKYFPVEMIVLKTETVKKKVPEIKPPVVNPKIDKKPVPKAKPKPPEEKVTGLEKAIPDKPEPEPEQAPKPKASAQENIVPEETVAPVLPTETSKTEAVYQPFHKLSKSPEFEVQVKPVYPPVERYAEIEARVIVEVYISKYGDVDDVKFIKSGGKHFDQAVLKAVMDSSFNPGEMDGRPVPVRVTIPYVFKFR